MFELLDIQHASLIKPRHLLYAVILFSIVISVLVVAMLFLLVRKNKESRRKADLMNQMQDWIGNIVLDEVNHASETFEVPVHIHRLVKDKVGRKILLQLLVDLKRQINGTGGENLVKLYMQMNLHNDSLQKLRSKAWHIKIAGIQELATMEQLPHTDKIFRLTNDNNEYIRMEAQRAMVNMYGYKGLRFLNVITRPMSDWHQLMLLDLLQHHPDQESPELLSWLHSREPTITCFILKIIAAQQDRKYIDDIKLYLFSMNLAIQEHSLKALAEMSLPLDEELILEIFRGNSPALQRLVIKSILKTGQDVSLHLYCSLQEHVHPEVRFLLHTLSAPYFDTTGISGISSEAAPGFYPNLIAIAK